MATEELHFDDREALERWLSDKPVGWSRVIAFRAALRVVPMVGFDSAGPGAEKWLSFLLIALFRYLIISINGQGKAPSAHKKAAIRAERMLKLVTDGGAYGAYASYNAVAGAIDAAEAAERVDDSAEIYRVVAAKYAAVTAQFAAAAYVLSAEPSLGGVFPDSIWNALSSDARLLAGSDDGDRLSKCPLWSFDVEVPARFMRGWGDLLSYEPLQTDGFEPWFRWYEALVPLDGSDKPRDLFGSELTRRIVLQSNEWWDRGAAAVNADIAAWLAEKVRGGEEEPALDVDVQAALDSKPEQRPAAYQTAWTDRGIVALPVAMDASNPAMAAVFHDEAFFKLREFQDRLAGANCDPKIKQTVDRLLAAVPEQVEALNPALLRSRARTLDNDLAHYLGSDELSDEVKSRLGDVAGSTRDLLGCYPQLRDVEAEVLALNLQSAGTERLDAVAAAADEITNIVAAPKVRSVVDGSVPVAMREMAAGADPERGWTPDAVKQLADRVLVTGNFLSSFAIGAVVEAFNRRAGVSEKWRSARPVLVRGMDDCLTKLEKVEGQAAIAGLVGSLYGPAAGLAVLGGSFLLANTLIDIAKRYLDKVADRTDQPDS